MPNCDLRNDRPKAFRCSMSCRSGTVSSIQRLSTKSALGKALQYALSRWDALTRYTTNGRLSIDNNLSERLLRGIALTRKNFSRFRQGRRACSGHIHADRMRQTQWPRSRGLSRRRPRRHGHGHSINRIDELLPWNWQRSRVKLAA
jgi:transposase